MNNEERKMLGAVTSATLALITTGTFFYNYFEGWTLVDSLYFSVITLTTVGYGDLSPTLPITKMFTVIYIVLGIGVLATFINLSAKARLNKRVEKKRK